MNLEQAFPGINIQLMKKIDIVKEVFPEYRTDVHRTCPV